MIDDIWLCKISTVKFYGFEQSVTAARNAPFQEQPAVFKHHYGIS